MDFALLRRLSLNHLATLLAIEDAGSFRGASARLNISQSALSVHVQQLEHLLEVRLLDRTTRSIAFTPEGRRLLSVVRMLALELTSTARLITEEARLQRRIIRIATVPFLAKFCSPDTIAEIAQAYPGAEIRIFIREASKLVGELVRQGDADIGLAYWNPELSGDDFISIFHDELVGVVPGGNPAFAARTSISIGELATFPFVIQPEGTFVRDLLDFRFESLKIQPMICHTVLHADAMIALVSAGVGVGLQPREVLSLFTLEGCRLLPVDDIPPRPVGLVLPTKRRSSAATMAVRDRLVASVRAQRLGMTLSGG